MKKVRIYTTPYCPFCLMAKDFFENKNIEFEEIDVAENQGMRAELIERYQWKTVPMIFIGDEFVGGYQDVQKLDGEGKFDELLQD